MKKVAFRNLGCKVNEYEMDYMQQIMEQNGYEIVPFDAKADIYIVNTCTVTNIADRKSRQMLHRAKKLNPDSIVVAAGCYVQTDTEGAKKDDAIDIIIGNNRKSELVDIINSYIAEHKGDSVNMTDSMLNIDYEDMHITKTAEHTRAFIKIQDGCDQYCSYCAIPIARGSVRSRSIDNIIEEVVSLSQNGYKELVVTGIHLSSYGIDFHKDINGRIKRYNELTSDGGYTNYDLLEVLEAIARIDGIKRIRLGSLEPRLITEEFMQRLKKIDKMCPHFHLSLQSGCDETLKRMNRKYSTDEFMKGVELIRNTYDKPAITTDVIVGFPGETKEEFDQTVEYLRKIKFFELHVFKYSPRDNTVAASMAGQISPEVKDLRSDVLINMDEELSKEYKESYMGKEVEVLIEELTDGIYVGHTREYIKVGARLSGDVKGEIIRLPIDGETLFFV